MKYIKKLELNKHTVRMPIFGELVKTLEYPNKEEIMNKINEIIDVINSLHNKDNSINSFDDNFNFE